MDVIITHVIPDVLPFQIHCVGVLSQFEMTRTKPKLVMRDERNFKITRSIPEGMPLLETTATNMTTNQTYPKILNKKRRCRRVNEVNRSLTSWEPHSKHAWPSIISGVCTYRQTGQLQSIDTSNSNRRRIARLPAITPFDETITVKRMVAENRQYSRKTFILGDKRDLWALASLSPTILSRQI